MFNNNIHVDYYNLYIFRDEEELIEGKIITYMISLPMSVYIRSLRCREASIKSNLKDTIAAFHLASQIILSNRSI